MSANAVVESRLDYCNSLFRHLSALDFRKLQCVQNSLAKIVTNTTKYSHITPVRKILHWLLIEHRSIFETALLVYKFLHKGHPKYLHLSLNLDTVSITHVKAKLMVCSLRSHTLPLQYMSPLNILASALLMMLQRFGMICLMMYVQLFSPLIQKEAQNLSLCTSMSTLSSLFPGFTPWRRLFLCPRLIIIVLCFFGLVRLESVFRWRLSTIKILLELLKLFVCVSICWFVC